MDACIDQDKNVYNALLLLFEEWSSRRDKPPRDTIPICTGKDNSTRQDDWHGTYEPNTKGKLMIREEEEGGRGLKEKILL